jgi:HD-GYP domain-containing protein (c-di-GMP phosphodiesterase class II)/HAMP domain-containing protein
MRLTISGIKLSILHSRIARRIFLLFILCALLPVCLLAIFSIIQVRSQLKENAEVNLHQNCKTAGMTLFNRIAFIENDLDRLRQQLLQNSHDSPETLLEGFTENFGQKFKSLALADRENRIIGYTGTPPRLPALTDEEEQHLQQGHALFTSRPSLQGEADLFTAVPILRAGSNPEILYGEIRPDYLWSGDEILDPITEISVFNESGLLLFSSAGSRAPFRELTQERQKNYQSGLFEWIDGGKKYIAAYWTLFLRPTYLNSLVVAYSESRNQVLAPIGSFSRTFLLVVLLTLWIVLFLSLNQIRRSMVPIEQLQDATRKIRSKDFSGRVQIQSNDEFQELGASFNEMTESLQSHIHTMDLINQIGVSLSTGKNDFQLLKMVLDGAREAVRADGAALYLEGDDATMELTMMHVGSLELWIEKSESRDMDLYKVMNSIGKTSSLNRATVHIKDIHSSKNAEFEHLRIFDTKAVYRTQSLLSVPLKSNDDETIGILQLINARDRKNGTWAEFTAEDRRLVESLASQVAVALTKNRLAREFKALFEGLTEMIGTAIDQKSAYTGGHCKRVPLLAQMLVKAVSKTDTGPFKDFHFSPEAEYELRIAALLHDCGKVTTPVHIADKATKLETIVDRIELIRTRFEILKRDRQVTLLRQLAASNGGESRDITGLDEEVARFTGQLEKELAFLENCNLGSESMPADFQKKILEIAHKYSWMTMTGKSMPFLSDEEIDNLSVRNGTLTSKERKIINDHIVTGVRMLQALPYPKNLRNIPLYVGSHHERVNGQGYPAGLKGDQIPLQGKILAIADIFEALTAADRPYHKKKTLSEALEILQQMRDEGKIDPDLHDIFLNEKIYIRYARQFLLSDQIDVA